MLEVALTDTFTEWLTDLRDRKGAAVIAARLLRVQHGLLGDTRPVGEGVSELRIHFGPGYRVYFTQREGRVVILLAGGDKASQVRDIRLAQGMVKNMTTLH